MKHVEIDTGEEHRRIRTVFLGMSLAMLLGGMEQTMMATALGTIGAELGNPAAVHWIVSIYLVASTVTTPLYGKISDILGRRIIYLTAIGIFVAGSVLCALAPSMPLLILARAIQGAGSGGLMSTAQTIIGDIVAPSRRGKYQAYIAAIAVTSSVSGPMVGGFLTEYLHWTMVFWINLPLGAAAFLMVFFTLRHLPRVERRHRLDLPGAALLTLAATLLLLALSWTKDRGIATAGVTGLFGASAAAWALFVWRLRHFSDPFLPIGLLSNRVVVAACTAGFFTFGTVVGLTMLMPMYLAAHFGLSPGQTGLALIAMSGGTITGATLSGRLSAQVKNYKRLPVFGLGMAAASLALQSVFLDRLPFALQEALLATTGAGLGSLLPIATLAVQNDVPAQKRGTATSLLIFVRLMGGAILVTLLGTIVAAQTGGAPASAPTDLPPFRLIFSVTLLTTLCAFSAVLWMPQKSLRTVSAPS